MLTDNEIMKALECCISDDDGTRQRPCNGCPLLQDDACSNSLRKLAFDMLNRQKVEIEKNEDIIRLADKTIEKQSAEIERLQKANDSFCEAGGKILTEIKTIKKEYPKEIAEAKSEAYREFAEKITEVFMRYAHLHSYAEQARKSEVVSADGTKIELVSVWDVITLKKHNMAEYEEMTTLAHNIENIANERLLTELEKDFRLLAKELTESNE